MRISTPLALRCTVTPIVDAAHRWTCARLRDNDTELMSAFNHLIAATVEDNSTAGDWLFSPRRYESWYNVFDADEQGADSSL